ncbi:Aste57867_12879 [Aphanomyces stellatus]|uniref:Aste57867_12879 protein n=1 Tax=Aphanomyces stellatus TaxID=120398 RepID=A0A485KWP5_9STRA|nr:hypothetical protein As57867_012831 [Aphanomyces stellatus]VFT89726.1 Aste57867_12879 [Aphanomyces stellatus]
MTPMSNKFDASSSLGCLGGAVDDGIDGGSTFILVVSAVNWLVDDVDDDDDAEDPLGDDAAPARPPPPPILVVEDAASMSALCRRQSPPPREWAWQLSTTHLRPPPCETQRPRARATWLQPGAVQYRFLVSPELCLQQNGPTRALPSHPLVAHRFFPPWRTHRLRAYTWLLQSETEHLVRCLCTSHLVELADGGLGHRRKQQLGMEKEYDDDDGRVSSAGGRFTIRGK